ncbi:hypothetical protein E2C01_035466 [Portunus trituberculatus]|uniref:Uncharacterized protein n=1 Tax=Portunus trituberculatus TaxID=210409 RepID=A0A5B7F392_PORTR|nr:hypothetical protein [Portunus trituberculatus]
MEIRRLMATVFTILIPHMSFWSCMKSQNKSDVGITIVKTVALNLLTSIDPS